MSTYAVKKIDDMEAIYGGAFKRVRAELGVESFGMQIIDLPPNFDSYPEHDHSEDGQEEVYLALRGGGEIEIEGERHPLDEDHVAKVGPGVKRKVWPGDDGIRILIVGGRAGAAYEAPDVTKLGERDLCAGAQVFTESRRDEPAPGPLEQLSADALLEIRQLMAQRRLREMQLLSRAREVAHVGNRRHEAEVANFEA